MKMTTHIPNKCKVIQIWNTLEAESNSGFIKRLYTNEYAINVYCTLQIPEKYYGIALSFPNSIHFNLLPLIQLSEIKVAIFDDNSFKDCYLLSVQLTNLSYKDLFSYLCENLIESIYNQHDIVQAVSVFGNTLLRWKQLFSNRFGNGLSKEEQQGLYGELTFLEKCLKSNLLPYYDILQYYVGTNKSLRDFQGNDWAVEVKTTSTNNPQELTINGERQLDDSIVENIYLYHCAVEVSKSNGETLISKIDNLRNILKDDIPSLSLFNSKLFEAGYLNEHLDYYKDRCYKVRSELLYHVTGSFPRIKEKDLLPGVGHVRYGIVVANCEPYIVPESIVLQKCLNHE